MRVQLTWLGGRRLHRRENDGERGAVAVTVALLLIPLAILSAFVLDFGNAFAQRQALVAGADSAALSVVAKQQQLAVASPGKTCAQLVADDTALPAGSANKSTNIALGYINNNAPFGAVLTASDITVALSCNTVGTPALQATVIVKKNVPTSFGRLAGVNSLTVDRRSQAAMGVAYKVANFRPIGLCTYQAQDIVAHATADAAAGVPYRGELISLSKIWNGSQTCDGGGGSGNWGWLDCGQGNGASALGAVLATGCPGSLALNTATTPPSVLISGSPGNAASNTPVHDGMAAIMDQVVEFPVYDTYTGNGSGVDYRVIGFLSLKMCGYDITTRGACYDSTQPMSSNDLQVRYADYHPLGSLGGTCTIGSPCAYNSLVTKLVG